MQLSGSESFHVPRADLWRHLVDMDFMSNVIPHLERIEQVESDYFTCRVRPGLSFFSGKVSLRFEIRSRQPPDRLLVAVHGKGMGGSVAVDIELSLEEKDQGSIIGWTGTVSNKEGLFRPIGDSLISAAATRIVGELWATFRVALDRHSDATSTTRREA